MPRACPVTYFAVASQRQFEHNRAQIQGNPYTRYFDGELWLHEALLPALRAPMDVADALAPEQLNALLDPGYHAVENGYCELPDGTGYVASLVPFPGCSGEMYGWWFWWHAVESARYTLWYPHNHVAVRSLRPELSTRPGLTHTERYVGTAHHVDEYIGPDLLRVAIRFVEPAELGFDTSRFARAGIVGHACARVGVRGSGSSRSPWCTWRARRNTASSSAAATGSDTHRAWATPLGSIGVDGLARGLGLKRRMAGARVAYEQLLHDQIEFTHLSTFLAELDADLGPQR